MKAQSELLIYWRKIFGVTDEALPKAEICFNVHSAQELKYDGFKVEISDNSIGITSCEPRGILHGVYELLKQMGCNFIFPRLSQEFVPSLDNITLESKCIIKNPIIELRGLCLYNTTRETISETMQTVDYMAKNYYNLLLTSMCRYDDTDGEAHAILYNEIQSELLPALNERGILIDMSEHSTDYFFPRDTLYKEHPEWFALIDGKRVAGQICYANDDAVKTYAKAFVDFAKSHDEFFMLGTWPLDGGGYCQCEKCQDPSLILKVNEYIASEIHKVRPKLIIEHLAYTKQSFTCPQEPLPENMSVLVCSAKDDIAYNWGKCAEHSGGAFYFDYSTGDNYRYRANLAVNPYYINNMVNTFASYRYRGIISLFLPITAWWQSGINYSLLSASYYDPMQSVDAQLAYICTAIFGNANSEIMTKAMIKTVSELQSKLLWSGHPHKHSYMPQHNDNRTATVDAMHSAQYNKVYSEIMSLLSTVDMSAFTDMQLGQYKYFTSYLELQKIYFTDIDNFNSHTQNESAAEPYLEKLKALETELGSVFISENYARWRIVGRDNILKNTCSQNAYQPNTK